MIGSTRSWLARWLLASCALGGSGCSWLFVEEAPAAHSRMAYFDCTSSRLGPAADTTIAVSYGLTSGIVFAQADSDYESSQTLGFATLAVAGVAAASAAYGYSTTAECSEAKAELANRQARMHFAAGCARDVDCKGERVCERGLCVWPGGDGRAPSATAAARATAPDPQASVPAAQRATAPDPRARGPAVRRDAAPDPRTSTR